MARNPRASNSPNKKHLARIERERLQTRNIMIGVGATLIVVVLLILYGVLDQMVLKPRRPVATVNGERISVQEFQGQVRFNRYSLIQQARQSYQFLQFFGSDPNTMSSIASQLAQIQFQLTPSSVGDSTLERMIDNILIRQEAERRGIVISDADVDKYLQDQFGYFPNGTPTSAPTQPVVPTSTLSPVQETLTAPTATPVITQTATATPVQEVTPTAEPEFTATPTGPVEPTATLAPSPTPTPYTEEGYTKLRDETFTNLETDFNINQADVRRAFTDTLWREKLLEALKAEIDVPTTKEEVWARHILVQDQQLAIAILARLRNGEDWCALAAENSIDTSNKNNCGDLSWFGRGQMVAEFENAAFALGVGETSEPVSTSFGFHIIQVIGHEDRPLSASEIDQARQDKFDEFVAKLRETATITKIDSWLELVPTEPTLDPEIEQAIQAIMQGGTQP